MLATIVALEAGALAFFLAQSDPSPDLFSPKVLGVLGPFFGLLVAMLWRSEKKRDEAEELVRTTLKSINDTYQPTVQRFLDYIESEEKAEARAEARAARRRRPT